MAGSGPRWVLEWNRFGLGFGSDQVSSRHDFSHWTGWVSVFLFLFGRFRIRFRSFFSFWLVISVSISSVQFWSLFCFRRLFDFGSFLVFWTRTMEETILFFTCFCFFIYILNYNLLLLFFEFLERFLILIKTSKKKS